MLDCRELQLNWIGEFLLEIESDQKSVGFRDHERGTGEEVAGGGSGVSGAGESTALICG